MHGTGKTRRMRGIHYHVPSVALLGPRGGHYARVAVKGGTPGYPHRCAQAVEGIAKQMKAEEDTKDDRGSGKAASHRAWRHYCFLALEDITRAIASVRQHEIGACSRTCQGVAGIAVVPQISARN